MEQFVDGQHVRLRSTVLGRYLHADDDGDSVSLQDRRASPNSAWAVELHNRDDYGPHVLLYSAAYGRCLAATDARAPVGRGLRVEQRNHDHPDLDSILWRVFRMRGREGVHLRNVNGGCLLATRVLGHYRGNGVSAEDTQFIPMMMNWVVEPIPAMHIPPALPAEVPLPVAMLTWREIDYVWLNADGDIITDGWYPFDGRSLLRLSTNLAVCLSAEWGMEGVPDVVICLPARGGRLLPLVVDLPSSEQDFRVVVLNAGSPAHTALRYADVDAE
ncbi:hypothetical protein ACQJBY_071766 [Aegilops geniculata]